MEVVGVPSFEGIPVPVIRVDGEPWVALVDIERCLRVAPDNLRRLLSRRVEEFEGLVRSFRTRRPETYEGLGTPRPQTLAEQTGDSVSPSGGVRPSKEKRAGGRPADLYLNRQGIFALVMMVQVKSIRDPETQQTVLGFRRFLLSVLDAYLTGRALPAGSPTMAVPAWVERLSGAERSRLHRGLFHQAKAMPVSILVPLAASIGIGLDGDAIAAERAAPRSPGSDGRSGASGGDATGTARPGASPATTLSSDPDTLTHTYLEALRGIVAEHPGRISGMEPGDGAGRPPVPLRGYIGGLANTHRDGRTLRVLALLPGAANELLTARLGPLHTGRTFVQAMQRAGAWVGDPTKPHVTAIVSYKRADGRKVRARHYCLLVERLWVEDGAGAAVGAETR